MKRILLIIIGAVVGIVGLKLLKYDTLTAQTKQAFIARLGEEGDSIAVKQFTKTNGIEAIVDGVQTKSVTFKVTFTVQSTHQATHSSNGISLFGVSKPLLEAGATEFTTTGTAAFAKTDNGWLCQGVDFDMAPFINVITH
ncbi:MAG TPA: hypothetical protein VIH86_00840 [Puia sp.]